MRKIIIWCIILLIPLTLLWVHLNTDKEAIQLPLSSNSPAAIGDKKDKDARIRWHFERLKDPATGKIPEGIRHRELAYSRNLPKQVDLRSGYGWKSIGPYSVGGRTRAMAIDRSNEQIILSGGVSGGLWRSVNSGQSWTKVTAPDQLHSITCITQDTRQGKMDTWYYGTGEIYGNSASESFSADYLGDGIFKSADGGKTWKSLPSTAHGTPQKAENFDRIWNIAADPAIDSLDIVYAAIYGKVMRSDDGGKSWTDAIGTTSYFTDVAVTGNGVVYATLSSTSITMGQASQKGIWRSDDGVNWTNISKGTGWPEGSCKRAVIGIDPNNENKVYFLGNTPGNGQLSQAFFDNIEYNSLWKYEYISGNGSGSGGKWTDLSSNLPAGGMPFDNFYVQGSYDMTVAIQPGNSNMAFIGGTNLYRSSDGFTTPNNITQVGGYKPGTALPYFELYPNHHPDQHGMDFLPSDPKVMISANDGGIYKTKDCTAPVVTWDTLNNGYTTSQFYTITLDHGTPGSNVVTGGLQDNGSRWTGSSDPKKLWTFPSHGDGSFCAVEDGGGMYYYSRQRGRILKVKLDANGVPTGYNRIDPVTDDTVNGGNYLFINPFILDPVDNNIMYVAEGNRIWRNDSLSDIPLDNKFDSISLGWFKLNNMPNISSNARITALSCSENPAHVLYFGTANGDLYRMKNAHKGNPVAINRSNGLANGYISCIAVDPRDADKVMVVFSNYNTYSLFYSENGGMSWDKVAGNLETGPPPGLPPNYVFIGDGPSTRWASIIPVVDGTVYLLGTSVGLYATTSLVADSTTGDSTVWIQQSPNLIGNVVIEMMDYRQSDGFVAVATHGNGVYTGYIMYAGGVSGRPPAPGSVNVDLNCFPNPVNDHLQVRIVNPMSLKGDLKLSDAAGNFVRAVHVDPGQSIMSMDVSRMASGIYFLTYEGPGFREVKKILIQ